LVFDANFGREVLELSNDDILNFSVIKNGYHIFIISNVSLIQFDNSTNNSVELYVDDIRANSSSFSSNSSFGIEVTGNSGKLIAKTNLILEYWVINRSLCSFDSFYAVGSAINVLSVLPRSNLGNNICEFFPLQFNTNDIHMKAEFTNTPDLSNLSFYNEFVMEIKNKSVVFQNGGYFAHMDIYDLETIKIKTGIQGFQIKKIENLFGKLKFGSINYCNVSGTMVYCKEKNLIKVKLESTKSIEDFRNLFFTILFVSIIASIIPISIFIGYLICGSIICCMECKRKQNNDSDVPNLADLSDAPPQMYGVTI